MGFRVICFTFLFVLVEGQHRHWDRGGRGEAWVHEPMSSPRRAPPPKGFDRTEQRIQQWCQRKQIYNPRTCKCKIWRFCERRGSSQRRGMCSVVDGWDIEILNCRQNNNAQVTVAPQPHNPHLAVDPQPQHRPASDNRGKSPSSKGQSNPNVTNGRRGDRGRSKKCDMSKLLRLKSSINRVAQREKAQQDAVFVMRAPVQRRLRNPNAKRQRTELTVNNPDLYYQGDVDLTNEQADLIIRQMDQPSGRKKRKIGVLGYRLWNSMPISLSFDSSYPETGKRKVREAIRVWEENTCIRFEEDGPNTNRIEFVDGGGCSSMVGMVGGTQEISIAVPGCDFVGIICHEIGHSLGFFHEQARPDRDSHVNINYNNINFLRWNNFIKGNSREINYFNQPYDYGSVMHYSGYGFANNDNIPTIETKEPEYQDTIGQRRIPSFIDFAQVNAAYCKNKCSPRNCQHNGYVDPNNCNKCKCPDGWGGDQCEEVAHFKNCGGEYQAYKQQSLIATPNYPNRYPRDHECSFLLKTYPGHKIFMEFVETFEFECKDTCEMSFAEVKTGGDWRRVGPRFCCSNRPTQRFESEGHEMVVMMKGYGSSTYRGFKAKYWTDAPKNKPGGGTVSVTPKPQTTPRPTTRRPIQTPPPPPPSTGGSGTAKGPTGSGTINRPGCVCGDWGLWSDCSQICGGCGHKQRRRTCNKADCYDTEKRKCNFAPCKGKSWLWANNEFHLLIDECCIGLFKGNDGQCGGIQNIVGELISSFLPSLSTRNVPTNRT